MKSLFDGLKVNFINVVALLLLTACISYFFWISGIKSENHNIGEIKTALINVVMLIVGYYFGSSKSSAKKDDTINTMQDTINKS